jgi:glycosyltransferase involved in cell wall biosynthesis
MTITVIMPTYNGEKYLREQLDSILWQTRLPDEFLVFDDCSSDSTPNIISEYASKYPQLNISLTIREQNIGWKRNFLDGILNITGDIVFICDQDDVWYKDKIDAMCKIIESDTNILCLSCGVTTINTVGEIIPQLKNHAKTPIEVCAYQTDLIFNDRIWAGHRLAFRNTGTIQNIVRDMSLLNEPDAYDMAIALWARISGGLYLMKVPLVVHRVFAESATADNLSIARLFSRERMERRIVIYQSYDQLAKRIKDNIESEDIVVDYNDIDFVKYSKEQIDAVYGSVWRAFVKIFKAPNRFSKINLVQFARSIMNKVYKLQRNAYEE